MTSIPTRVGTFAATVLLAVTATAAGGLAPAAHADTTPYEMARMVPAGAGYQSALRAEINHWTTGRIAAAALNDDTGNAIGRGSDAVPPADGWNDLAAPWKGQGLITGTAGKLLLRVNDAATGQFDHLAACTATVVQSANRSVAVTAGHCFREQLASNLNGPNHIAVNAVFVPGFDGTHLTRIPANLTDPQAINDYVRNTPLPGPDIAPYGVWGVTRVWLTNTWSRNKNNFSGNDMAAFLVDNPDATAPIQDITGGQAIAFDHPRGQFMTAFGYPTFNRTSSAGSAQWYAPQYDGNNLPLFGKPGANGVPAGQVRAYDGRALIVSRGTTTPDTGGNFDDIMPTAQAQGSSGGPWFDTFDPATGTGTLIGVVSHFVSSSSGGFGLDQIWNPARPYMAGTHFADQERAVYQIAAAATPRA
ncbi:trypsin-like serine peptidase [Streptosporangium sp. NPDC000396]|uniref:trypsin-like serine peptidase n=1 Tax=Streptosporangium sp. NPDC000396 TaxID=3366185 RepID=UPI0036A45B89